MATNLGIDATGGAKIGIAKSRTKLTSRFHTLRRKKGRIATLRSCAAAYTCAIFAAGPQAAAAYGSQVWG